MNEKFDDLEDIFADISEKKENESISKNTNDTESQNTKINKQLIEYYSLNFDLLDLDIQNGIIPKNVASDLRNFVYEYLEIEKDNQQLGGTRNMKSKNKTKVKSTKAGKLLHESYDLGFAEPLLLGLVVSSIGFVYLCYLYLVI